MKTKARTFHIDDDTFNNIKKLAGLKRVSVSAMARIIINDTFFARIHSESTTKNS